MILSTDEFIFHLVNRNEEAAVRQALVEAPGLARGFDGTLGTTALHCASHRGFIGIVAALLEAGADVYAREKVSDSTALHWAAEGGHPGVARMLVEHGAALDPIDSWWGLSPAGWATVVVWAPQFHEDRPATLTYLLGAGAKLDIFSAVVLGHEAAVRALVGADPKVISQRMGFAAAGVEPLQLAVSRRLTAMAALLLDLGANLESRTTSGMTALAMAMGGQDAATEALLRARGAADDISSAVVMGDDTAAARLLEIRAEKDALNPLLAFAAQLDRAAMVELLVAHGADPNFRSKQLIREIPTLVAPLHLAAMHGQVGAVHALLKCGAQTNPSDSPGIPTPLHLAAGSGHVAAVQVLLSGGADVNATEAWFGATPAGWAEHGNHAAVLALLNAPR